MPTLNQLRELLRERGQSTSGNKAALEMRWNNWTKLAGDLEDAELPIEGSLEEMEKRLLTPYTPIGDGSGLVVQTKTCPNRTDPLRGEILKPGTKIHQLRNTNGSMSKCYTDRTMKMFTETSEAYDGPFQEDMGSFSYPYSVEGRGDVVVRRSWDITNHVLLPFSACKGNQDIIAAYVKADNIPANAFEMCSNLKYVNLPESLKTIGRNAFQGCTFASLVIPAGLTELGNQDTFSVNYVTYLGKPEGENVLRVVPDGSIPAALQPALSIAVFIGGEVLDKFFSKYVVPIPLGQRWVKDLGAEGTHDPNIQRMLVSALDDVNRVVVGSSGVGATPLYKASVEGNAGLVKILIDAGADVNKANIRGETPLYGACAKGYRYATDRQIKIVKMLLDAEADVNKERTKDGDTPLLNVAGQGQISRMMPGQKGKTSSFITLAEMLIAAGADVNHARTDTGATALYLASSSGFSSMVMMLLGAGADPDIERLDDNRTPLWVATFYNDFDIAKMLLDAGADMDVPDHKPQGTTAFKLAMAIGGEMERLFMSYVPPPPPN